MSQVGGQTQQTQRVRQRTHEGFLRHAHFRWLQVATLLCAVAVFCLASGQVVSYTKARGESLGFPVDVSGLIERAERLVISLVAASRFASGVTVFAAGAP